jgi:hypothetical protein
MNHQSQYSTETKQSSGDLPRLEQNIPNPFDGSTIIKFYIPQQVLTAQIIISSLNGVAIKTIDVAQSGLGQVSITAGELASGTYQYSLMIKGKLVDIKQMELIR